MNAQHDAAGVYQGSGIPHDGIERLPPPPPWRTFDGGPPVFIPDQSAGDFGELQLQRARSYLPDPGAVEMINAALLLRRPLLVTGPPGGGKSSLAYSIAHELKLGPVLRWPVTRASTLRSGLYDYDALGRMQEANLRVGREEGLEVGSFIRLGPLGTALLPTSRPRVLLIDDFDQSDFDLPSELLSVLEEGQFEMPELARESSTKPEAAVVTADGWGVSVYRGRVRCRAFPVIVITSSGEREFPPRFLRRCLPLALASPGRARIESIVAAHLGEDLLERSRPAIEEFLDRHERGDVSTDQLLNAVFLVTSWGTSDGGGLASHVMTSWEADFRE
ncbi:AAA family ATPase [Streptomyces sp. NBC_01613]|uniref:AAA family ATPase n=1 Tax=Streptomyces sp. NBC_01613 TaxID=2975896 RepID=UPI00386821B1